MADKIIENNQVSIMGKIDTGLTCSHQVFGNDGIHGSVIFHQLHGFVDHQIFQPLFPHGLFIAVFFFLAVAHL